MLIEPQELKASSAVLQKLKEMSDEELARHVTNVNCALSWMSTLGQGTKSIGKLKTITAASTPDWDIKCVIEGLHWLGSLAPATVEGLTEVYAVHDHVPEIKPGQPLEIEPSEPLLCWSPTKPDQMRDRTMEPSKDYVLRLHDPLVIFAYNTMDDLDFPAVSVIPKINPLLVALKKLRDRAEILRADQIVVVFHGRRPFRVDVMPGLEREEPTEDPVHQQLTGPGEPIEEPINASATSSTQPDQAEDELLSRLVRSTSEHDFHGHVVPRSDGCRAKCGGPQSRVLRCAVCTAEAALLADGRHPLSDPEVYAHISAATRRLEARKPFSELAHKISVDLGSADDELMRSLVNFLGAVAWCGQVGHSATISMFVDGDGAGSLRIEGLPATDLKLGAAMAEAASNHGDSLMVEVGPSSASAYSTQYDEQDRTYYTRTCVFPKSEEPSEELSKEPKSKDSQ